MGYHDHNGDYHAFSSALLLSLFDFREVDSNGDVGNASANGGVLASDTTPILRGDSNESQEISWATGNTDIIAMQCALPPDFDGADDVTVALWVKSGTTDAATFTVETSWNGASLVSDTATDSDNSATAHKVTATVAAADVPDDAAYMTLLLTPGSHSTDTIELLAARVEYTPKSTSV
ncbi:MAG: hypothetical protein GVY18_09080 [Bacteroidetes bacterium]|jgi:hypothetical protein|nr:hypothetical protein [Bacteroidota bacterium]